MSASFTVQGIAVRIRVHGSKRPHVIEKPSGRIEGVVPKGMPYPIAMAALRPMVEELLRKRPQPASPDRTTIGETSRGRHVSNSPLSTKERGPSDYFPSAKGELELNIDGLPVHVTFVSRKYRFLRICPSGRVETVVPSGSSRDDVVDFVQNNIVRVRKSIDELSYLEDISEVIIFDDGSNTQYADANEEYRTYGLKVYVKFINDHKVSLQVSFGGDVVLGVNENLRTHDIINILKRHMHLVKDKINEAKISRNSSEFKNRSIKACLLAYQDFLIKIIPVQHGLSVDYGARTDGIIFTKVPVMFTISDFCYFLEECKYKMQSMLEDRYFLEPTEQELQAPIETIDTINCNQDIDKNSPIEDSAIERAMKYVGLGEYREVVDGIKVNVIVDNISKQCLRVVSPGTPLMIVPPNTRKSDVLGFIQENIAWLRHAIEEVKSKQDKEFLKPGRTTYQGYTVDVEFDARRSRKASIQKRHDGVIVFKVAPGMTRETFNELMAGFIDRLQKKLADTEAGISRDKQGKVYSNGMDFWLWGEKYILNAVEDNLRADAHDVKVNKDQKTIEIPVHTGRLFDQLAWYVTRWSEQCIAIRGRQYLDEWEKNLGIASVSLHVRMMKTKWSSCSEQQHRVTVSPDLIHRDARCLEFLIARELMNLSETPNAASYDELLNQHIPEWRKILESLSRPFPPPDTGC
ncbi:MAG: M48 family metallopeptidase [Desulfovibrio sp.]|jgi:predicted metal-dependent hydrolase|nr:M48 family metallopeptidase [Desulfovibrio sp.]